MTPSQIPVQVLDAVNLAFGYITPDDVSSIVACQCRATLNRELMQLSTILFPWSTRLSQSSSKSQT